MVMDMMGGGGAPSDLASALGAGGAPPQGGPPSGPDLAALLGSGGGQQGGPDQGQAPNDPLAIVQQMLDLGKAYLDVEPDHEDLLSMQKVLTMLQQLLTKDQQDADQAMSGQTNPRAMRKAFGG